MAKLIEENIYRVSLDSERNYVHVSAADTKDLINFLVDEFVGRHDIYGVKQVNRDGSITTVQVVTSELFQKLSSEKLLSESLSEQKAEKASLEDQISLAANKQHGKGSQTSEKSVPER